MFLKDCWMTLLEIKERISDFKKQTNGKESQFVIEEATNSYWPFPRNRPSNSGDDSDEG